MSSFATWHDVLKLNTTGKLPSLLGVQKNGTKFISFQLAEALGLKYLGEYFNLEYYYFRSHPDKDIFDSKWGGHSVEWESVSEKVKSEVSDSIYEQWKTEHTERFIKFHPNHIHDLEGKEYYQTILDTYFWFLLFKKDWVRALLSQLYTKHHGKIDELNYTPFEIDPCHPMMDQLVYSYQILYEQKTQMQDCTIFYTEDVLHLPLSENTPNYLQKDNSFYKKVITNYDELLETSIEPLMLKISEATNGWVDFDNKGHLYINEEK